MINCWEYLKCGREQNGARAGELGECPASTEKAGDGINRGKNSGRLCWLVGGTLCGGVVQGTSASKIDNCKQCDFFKLVQKEEGTNFILGI